MAHCAAVLTKCGRPLPIHFSISRVSVLGHFQESRKLPKWPKGLQATSTSTTVTGTRDHKLWLKMPHSLPVHPQIRPSSTIPSIARPTFTPPALSAWQPSPPPPMAAPLWRPLSPYCLALRCYSRLVRNQKDRTKSKIRVKMLQLIDDEGNNLGIVSRETAQGLAEAKGVELVAVQQEKGDAKAIYRMISKKQLWEDQKKQKQLHKKDPRNITKEITFVTNIAEHDLAVKVRHMREFLEKMNSVQLTIETKARREEEIARERQRQRELLAQVAKEVDDMGTKVNEKITRRKLVCLFRSVL